ncbi:MAG: polysaccharide biosynthesis/export family protein [Planctomycetota bacterium]
MSFSKHLRRGLALSLIVAIMAPGCSTYHHTVPGYCVGDSYQESRSDKEPINFLLLRREAPDAYRLDERDVLGVYIEGVLGNKEEPPPVNFPAEDENLPPSIGFPFPIREDGTISLPLVKPIQLRGLTLQEAERKIRETYIARKILKPERERIIVTLMKPRTYHVLVVREDETADTSSTGLLSRLGGNAANYALALQLGQTRAGMSYPLELKAYENDVLHALSETGGLPGTDAMNEVIILRGAFDNQHDAEQLNNCLQDPAWIDQQMGQPDVVKIPLRVGPSDPVVQLSEQDVILNRGDVVYVRSRESEVFYTGGLLPGGQWPLPRDYDIDVFQAISLAGGNIGSSAGSTDSGLLRGGGSNMIIPATRVIVLREMCGETVPIEIHLRRAMLDPEERIRILPGDFIVLEYTPLELVGNIVLSTLRFNFFLNN